jgi:hypothetical protein
MALPEPSVNVRDLESLRAWLVWNDPNGCYADDECDAEGLPRLALTDAQMLYRTQSAEDTQDICPQSPDGHHRPDWATLTPADDFIPKRIVVDVNCQYCGRSGSTTILPDEINW